MASVPYERMFASLSSPVGQRDVRHAAPRFWVALAVIGWSTVTDNLAMGGAGLALTGGCGCGPRHKLRASPP
jgi:hypothetical protein